MENLRAGVQYNDFVGTAAADRNDDRDFEKILEEQGLFDPQTDFVFAIQLWSGENHGKNLRPASVSVLLADVADAQNPKSLRRVDVQLTYEEFFVCFKRLEIILTHRVAEIDKEYHIISE